MPGTFRNLSKALEPFFTSVSAQPDQPLPKTLPDELIVALEAYVEKHDSIETCDTPRLHDELLRIYYLAIVDNPELQSLFLQSLILLTPCLINTDHLKLWFEIYVKIAIDSAGGLNDAVEQSRQFLMAVMTHLRASSDKRMLTRYQACSKMVVGYIIDIYLGDIGWFDLDAHKNKHSERQRFIRMNAKDLFIQYGLKRPLQFFDDVNQRFVERHTRLDILSLLSAYVSLQSPHLTEIRKSPLLDNLVNCLINDLSSTLLSICITVISMILPHICVYPEFDPLKLFVAYGRLASWYPPENESLSFIEGKEGQHSVDETDNHTQSDEKDSIVSNGTWQPVGHLFKIFRNPNILPLFTFLYGLYPGNVIDFIRDTKAFFARVEYRLPADMDFWDNHEIRGRSKPLFDLHLLNPSLISMSLTDEFADNSRWKSADSAVDIASKVLSLYNRNVSGGKKSRKDSAVTQVLSSTDDDIPETGMMYDNYYDEIVTKRTEKISETTSSLSASVDLTAETAPVANIANTTATGRTLDFGPDRVPSPLDSSPSLRNLDALLDQHQRLYGKKDSYGAEKHDGSPRIDGSPTEISGSSAVITAAETSSPSSRMASLSSPSLLPSLDTGSIPSISEQITGATQVVTALNVTSPQHSSTVGAAPSLSPFIMPLDPEALSKHPKPEFEEINTSSVSASVAFYQRELLLMKNEIDFISFLEHNSQYRFRKMKEEAEQALNLNEDVRRLVSTIQTLRKKSDRLKNDLEQSQKRTRTYKNERQSYEAQLLTKNKELRAKNESLTKDVTAINEQLELLKRENDALLKISLAKETKISNMELQLAEISGESRLLGSYKRALREAEDKIARLERKYLKSPAEEVGKVDDIFSQIRRLTLARDAAEMDKDQLEIHFTRQINSLKSEVRDYQEKLKNPSPKILNLIEEFRKSSEDQYNRLKAAHEQLVERNAELESNFRNYKIRTESERSRALLSPSPEGSATPDNDSDHNQSALISRDSPSGSIDKGKRKSQAEVRIRGRGGVQNIGAKPKESAPRAKVGVFRGLVM